MERKRDKWRLTLLMGATVGVILSVALSVLVREGTQFLRRGLDLFIQPDLVVGGPLLLLAGVVTGVLLVTPRLHPLVAGVPAIWFAIVFVPVLFDPTLPDDYPRWVLSFYLGARGTAPYLVLGVLAAVSVTSLVGFPPRHSQLTAPSDANEHSSQ